MPPVTLAEVLIGWGAVMALLLIAFWLLFGAAREMGEFQEIQRVTRQRRSLTHQHGMCPRMSGRERCLLSIGHLGTHQFVEDRGASTRVS